MANNDALTSDLGALIATAINNRPTKGSVDTALATKAADSAVVHLTGNEAVAGTKTFSAAPVVPDGSFTQAKVAGLPEALASLADSGVTMTLNPDGTYDLTVADSAPVEAVQNANGTWNLTV